MILMLKVFLNDNNDDNSDDVEKKGKQTFKDRVSNQPSSMLQKKKMNQHKFLRFIFSVKLPISSLQESAFPPHFPHRSNFSLEYIK